MCLLTLYFSSSFVSIQFISFHFILVAHCSFVFSSVCCNLQSCIRGNLNQCRNAQCLRCTFQFSPVFFFENVDQMSNYRPSNHSSIHLTKQSTDRPTAPNWIQPNRTIVQNIIVLFLAAVAICFLWLFVFVVFVVAYFLFYYYYFFYHYFLFFFFFFILLIRCIFSISSLVLFFPFSILYVVCAVRRHFVHVIHVPFVYCYYYYSNRVSFAWFIPLLDSPNGWLARLNRSSVLGFIAM